MHVAIKELTALLRKAEIMDTYGFEGRATRAINHRTPNDVTRDDLDFYGWVYAFLGFEDLLFYLYPIALELDRSKSLDCIDSFMYSLNRGITKGKSTLDFSFSSDLNTWAKFTSHLFV